MKVDHGPPAQRGVNSLQYLSDSDIDSLPGQQIPKVALIGVLLGLFGPGGFRRTSLYVAAGAIIWGMKR